MKKSIFSSTNAMILAAFGIAINLVLGTITQLLHIPLLFLDTIGTILVAAVLGPLAGALTGGLTNVIQGAITNPKSIPFGLVNIAVGLIVGFIVKRFGFSLKVAVITGVILSIIAPLIGTPIAVFMYGGLSGGGIDFLFAALLASGEKIFTAAFIPRILGNLIDKIASCILVAIILPRMPKKFLVSRVINNDK